MNKRRLNEIAVALEKVNYLYRNMRKSNEPIKRLELALLKKYVLDLYDNILVMEMPDLEMEQHDVVLEKPKFEYKPSIINPIIVQKEPEPEPVAIIQEPAAITQEPAAITQEPVVIVEDEPIEEPIAQVVEKITAPEAIVEVDTPNWTEPTADVEANENGKSTPLHEWGNNDDDDSAKTQVLDDFLRRDSIPSANIDKESIKLVADFDEDEGETIAIGELNNLLGKQKETETPQKDTGGINGDSIKFPVTFNQRIAFIRELFSNNEKAYHDSMKELSDARGYIEALTYINLNLRYDFNWKDNDPTVKEFLEMIKHRFLG